MNGMPAAEAIRRTPGAPARIQLTADLVGPAFAANGADAVFVRAAVCDANGNSVPDATNGVDFAVSGAAQLVSPAHVCAEAGIATALIRSSTATPGQVLVRATAPALKAAHLELHTVK
jgi:beta-galactosidase